MKINKTYPFAGIHCNQYTVFHHLINEIQPDIGIQMFPPFFNKFEFSQLFQPTQTNFTSLVFCLFHCHWFLLSKRLVEKFVKIQKNSPYFDKFHWRINLFDTHLHLHICFHFVYQVQNPNRIRNNILLIKAKFSSR